MPKSRSLRTLVERSGPLRGPPSAGPQPLLSAQLLPHKPGDVSVPEPLAKKKKEPAKDPEKEQATKEVGGIVSKFIGGEGSPAAGSEASSAVGGIIRRFIGGGGG